MTEQDKHRNIQEWKKVEKSMNNKIEAIKEHASTIMVKLRNGTRLTKDEQHILRIFNSLTSGKAFNAGKRNDKHFQQTGK